MILVVFGTTGELIKLAPVLVRLERRNIPYVLGTTGQQVEQIPAFLAQFGIRQPDVWLAHGAGGRDLRVTADVPGWLATVGRSFAARRSWLRNSLSVGPGRPLVLVHGDTMTTVLGAGMGRALRVAVAHIEGGLRSFSLRHPFPEELNRRLTSTLARVHYAPGAWAASNLRRGAVVDTGANTIRDSLELVPDGDPPMTLPDRPFGVVSLHRFELLNDPGRLTETLEILSDSAQQTPLLFVDHSVTVAAIDRFRLGGLFDAKRFVRTTPPAFLRLHPSPAPLRVRGDGQRRQPGGVLLPRPALSRPSPPHGAARRPRRERCPLGRCVPTCSRTSSPTWGGSADGRPYPSSLHQM